MKQIRATTMSPGNFARLLTLVGLICSELVLIDNCFAQQSQKDSAAPSFWIAFERVDTPEMSLAAFPYVDIFVMDQDGHHVRRLTSDHRSPTPPGRPEGTKSHS